MSTPVVDERAARLVRQHAETARLLGVDFVPVIPRPRDADALAADVEAPAEAEPPPAPTAPVPTPPPARPAAPVPAVATPSSVPPPAPAPTPAPAAARSAGAKRAGKATQPDRDEAQRRLDALRARYEAEAPHQHFVTAHTNIVWGEGDPRARLMFIGEAPGADEDRTGRPFVGRAGQLLEKMIIAMGLTREDVYIANVLKTRPPNNATPTKEESALCAPYLFQQIAIIEPEVIVTLGLPAAKVVLGVDDTMTRLRGRWAEFVIPGSSTLNPGPTIPVMPTYHPAFLLRSYTPENRAKVWSDLQKVMDRLGLKAPGGVAEQQ